MERQLPIAVPSSREEHPGRAEAKALTVLPHWRDDLTEQELPIMPVEVALRAESHTSAPVRDKEPPRAAHARVDALDPAEALDMTVRAAPTRAPHALLSEDPPRPKERTLKELLRLVSEALEQVDPNWTVIRADRQSPSTAAWSRLRGPAAAEWRSSETALPQRRDALTDAELPNDDVRLTEQLPPVIDSISMEAPLPTRTKDVTETELP